jgi:hypothetical protein
MTSVNAADGEANSVSKKGIISFSVNGEAAKEIADSLTGAIRISKGTGVNRTLIKGKHIFCHTQALIGEAATTECSMNLDENGLINSSLFSSENNATGKVKTQKIGSKVQVSLIGSIAEQMLRGMKNVTEYGTMTTNKDSGDIKCSMVREFKIINARCTFFLDSNGSPSSK